MKNPFSRQRENVEVEAEVTLPFSYLAAKARMLEMAVRNAEDETHREELNRELAETFEAMREHWRNASKKIVKYFAIAAGGALVVGVGLTVLGSLEGDQEEDGETEDENSNNNTETEIVLLEDTNV